MIIGPILGIGARFLGSRTGAVVIATLLIVFGFLLWHQFDKSSAVRKAVAEYVADVELSSARAELALLKKAHEATLAANEAYEAELAEAHSLFEAQELELETYVSTTDAVVNDSLLGRLPNR